MSARARKEWGWFFKNLAYGWSLGWRNALGVLRGQWTLPRPAYCCICGCWSWSTWERAPYSSGCGYLCEECAEDNDRGLEAERQDVYGQY